MGLIHTKMYKSLQDGEADKYREGRPNRQLIQQGPIKNHKKNQARYRKTNQEPKIHGELQTGKRLKHLTQGKKVN